MTFRVTSLAIENQALRFAARHSADIFRFQQQLTSGLKFTQPSEQPIEFRQVAALNLQFNQLTVDLATIRSAESLLNNSVSQLQEANLLITSAITAVQQGIQSTETTDRNALALEIEGILRQFQSIANSTFNGEYLYGGTKTNRPPFTFDPPAIAGRSLNTSYLGSRQNSEVLVGDSLLIDTYYNGLTIFGPGQRQPTIIVSHSGAQAGTGTDSLFGRASLQVSHDTTTYDGLSGIQPGISSDSLDTVLGVHSLTVDDTSGSGTFGTISLNGGQPIPFDNTQTDLQIVGPSGEVVFVDTTTIAAGFVGTVTVNSSGFLSVDDGLTRTPIDFTTSQIVHDSISGGFVTIDSSAIVRSGIDWLEFPGTSDAFQVLHNLIDDLRNDTFPDIRRADVLERRLGDLHFVRENLLAALGEQSTSLRTLESVRFRNQTLALQVQNDASEIQATDFSEAALRLRNAESLLQFTFAVTAQLTSINILNFLR